MLMLNSLERDDVPSTVPLPAGWRETGLVFTMPSGEGLHPTSVSQAFVRLVSPVREATRDEIERRPPVIRFHDLRHTHASQLLAAGVNVKVVSERLGHASVAFTLDTYAHVMPGQQADGSGGCRCGSRRCWLKSVCDHSVTSGGIRAMSSSSKGFETAGQDGAGCENRTHDIFITSEVLCRLS